MEGYIITYRQNLTSKQITEINYFLFGKILSKAGKKYYYPGVLDSISYSRLGNGCYFITECNEDIIKELKTKDTFILVKAMIMDSIDELKINTAREFKKESYKGIFVKNL